MKFNFVVIAFFVSLALLFNACQKEEPNILLNAEEMPPMTSYKTYGGSNDESAHAILSVSSDTYLIAGSTNSSDGDISQFKGGSGDAWVLQTKDDGTIQWETCLGGTGWDDIYDIIKGNEGGYYVVGRSSSSDISGTNNNGNFDGLIAKLDEEGNILWIKQYGGSADDELKSITQTIDGQLVAVGFTQSELVTGVSSAWVIKIDTEGELIWEKAYGGSGEEAASAVTETPDGGVYVGGVTDSNDGDIVGDFIPEQAGWLLKLDTEGAISWQKILKASGDGIIHDIAITNNGGVIAVGQFDRIDKAAGFYRIFDPNGNNVNGGSLGSLMFSSIQAVTGLPNGQFYIAGHTFIGPGEIEKINQEGELGFIQLNVQQAEIAFGVINDAGFLTMNGLYGGFGDDFAFDVMAKSNNEAVIVGSTQSDRFLIESDESIERKGGSDVWVMEISPEAR